MLSAKFKWTKEEYLTAHKINYALRMKEWRFRGLGYAFLATLVFGAFIAYSQKTYVTFGLGAILVVYWYVLRWPIYRMQLASRFSKHSSKDAEIFWSIDGNGLRGGSNDSKGEMSWSAVGKVAVAPEGFLIYQYPIFSWIPRTGFASASESKEFEELARSRVKEFVRVT